MRFFLTPARRAAARLPTILVVSLLFFAACMSRAINAYDEGIVLFGANRVLRGDIPHRDFFADYGPAQFYIIAGLFKVFGTYVAVERIWDSCVRACIVGFVFVLARRFAPPAGALIAAASCLLWLGYIAFYGYPAFPGLAAMLAAMLFLLPTGGASCRSPGAVGAGMSMGVAGLFRYDFGAAGLLCGPLIILITQYSLHAGTAIFWPAMRRGLARFSLGFLSVTAPVAILFLWCGALPDLFFDVIAFQAKYYARMRGLPFPGLTAMRIYPMAFSVYIPFAVCAAAVPGIVALAARRRMAAPAAPAPLLLPRLLSLVLLLIAFIAKGYVRVSPVHMSLALVVSAVLLAVLAQPIPGRAVIGGALLGGCLLMSAYFTWLCLLTDVGRARANVAWALHDVATSASGPQPLESCRMPRGLERLDCFEVDADTAATVQYIQQRTSPGDPVFVGLSRHDRIFVNDVLLYFALDRPSATKWHHFDPGLQTSRPVQDEMIAELRRAHPKYVVLENRWDDVREPNESVVSSGVTDLDDYLRRSYRPAAQFGANTVLVPVDRGDRP